MKKYLWLLSFSMLFGACGDDDVPSAKTPDGAVTDGAVIDSTTPIDSTVTTPDSTIGGACVPVTVPVPEKTCTAADLDALSMTQNGDDWAEQHPACAQCISGHSQSCATQAGEGSCAQAFGLVGCCVDKHGCRDRTCLDQKCGDEIGAYGACVEAKSECAIMDIAMARSVCQMDGNGGGPGNVVVPTGGEGEERGEVLYDQELNVSGGFGPLVSFNVPSDVVSMAVTVEGEDSQQILINEWKDGASTDLIYSNWTQNTRTGLCLDCKVRTTAAAGVLGALAPNSQDALFATGQHQIRPLVVSSSGTGATGSVRMRVIGKRLPSFPENGILNLNIYLSGTQGWTAANAAGSSSLQTIVNRLATTYAQAGVSIGRVEYYDIPAEHRIINALTRSGASADLMELFRLSDVSRVAGVNVFMVDSLMGNNGPQGGVLLGIAGGIPGPTGVTGNAQAGVAIAVNSHRFSGGSIGDTIAHEIGHYLGLFHSTEQIRGVYDPIDDSPQNRPTNLMYFSPSGNELSNWQGKVMRANPWVRH